MNLKGLYHRAKAYISGNFQRAEHRQVRGQALYQDFRREKDARTIAEAPLQAGRIRRRR